MGIEMIPQNPYTFSRRNGYAKRAGPELKKEVFDNNSDPLLKVRLRTSEDALLVSAFFTVCKGRETVEKCVRGWHPLLYSV